VQYYGQKFWDSFDIGVGGGEGGKVLGLGLKSELECATKGTDIPLKE